MKQSNATEIKLATIWVPLVTASNDHDSEQNCTTEELSSRAYRLTVMAMDQNEEGKRAKHGKGKIKRSLMERDDSVSAKKSFLVLGCYGSAVKE